MSIELNPRRVRQKNVLVDNVFRMKRRAFQELFRHGIDFQPVNLRTITDSGKITKILQVADEYSKYCGYLMSSNLDSFDTLFDKRKQTLDVIVAPIHIPLSFSDVDWIEGGMLFADYEEKIFINSKGKTYKGNRSTKEKGLSMSYAAGLELPGEYRENIELYEMANLITADNDKEEYGSHVLSLYVIRGVDGNLRKEIRLKTISTGGGATDHIYLYSEDGKMHDEGKTGISYPPGAKERREKRDHDLKLGLFQDYMAPKEIDSKKTWENIYRIMKGNYPPDFKPNDFAGLIVGVSEKV